MIPPHVWYIAASLVTLWFAWVSASQVLQKTALVLFFSCALSNFINLLGFTPPALQAANALIDVTGMALIALVGHGTRSKAALTVCGFYVVMMGLHLFTVARIGDNIHIYKLFLNILFAGQLLTTGGWSVGQIIDRLRNHHPVSVSGVHSHFRAGG